MKGITSITGIFKWRKNTSNGDKKFNTFPYVGQKRNAAACKVSLVKDEKWNTSRKVFEWLWFEISGPSCNDKTKTRTHYLDYGKKRFILLELMALW